MWVFHLVILVQILEKVSVNMSKVKAEETKDSKGESKTEEETKTEGEAETEEEANIKEEAKTQSRKASQAAMKSKEVVAMVVHSEPPKKGIPPLG